MSSLRSVKVRFVGRTTRQLQAFIEVILTEGRAVVAAIQHSFR
ncbi:hypothetical protein FHT17_004735 [Novosphingobium sp. SG916]|nr:hypothetical protein [Novosphingobium sp. SG919]NMN89803.1 hypothetical protein [Novosphingobium sp. SG916]